MITKAVKEKTLFDKIGGKKFIALLLASIIFLVSNRFSGDNLMWVLIAYMGVNVLQKFRNNA